MANTDDPEHLAREGPQKPGASLKGSATRMRSAICWNAPSSRSSRQPGRKISYHQGVNIFAWSPRPKTSAGCFHSP